MSVADEKPTGPKVTNERLRRGLKANWWCDGVVSDLAFKHARFSVDRCCMAALTETWARLPLSVAMAEFDTACSEPSGFSAHDEQDEGEPPSHAHVYHSGSNSQRKTRAVTLIEQCCTVIDRDGDVVAEAPHADADSG